MHPSHTRPKISDNVDRHASQFRLRPEECQQRLGARWDLQWQPVRWVDGEGAVSAGARFCTFATSRRLPRCGGVGDDAAVATTCGDSMDCWCESEMRRAGVRRSQQRRACSAGHEKQDGGHGWRWVPATTAAVSALWTGRSCSGHAVHAVGIFFLSSSTRGCGVC